MEIKIFCPMWGSDNLPLESFLTKVKKAGYDGVEMNIPFDDDYVALLHKLLKKYDLQLIAQQWLIGINNETVDAYLERLTQYLYHLAAQNPLFINSHTGKDFYSFEDNSIIIDRVNQISEETGVKILHETHRGRFNFSTFSTQLFLDKYPDLRLTADFSHWCCVSESLLTDQSEFMRKAVQRSDYIHARVGHPEGPQVNHPGAHEHKTELNAHLDWWKQILIHAKENGKKVFHICPEFGPQPYMQSLPFTNQVVANQWDLNLYMKDLIERELKTIV